MVMLWHEFAAKFKQRLSLSDLHEATDDTFEFATTKGDLPELFLSLRNSELGVDHGRIWRTAFSQKLEVIAAELTRKSQAAECRSLIIMTMEERSLTKALFMFDNPLFSRMFLDGNVSSDTTDAKVQAIVAKRLIFLLVDLMALITLHTKHFNSPLRYGDYGSDLTIMCDLSADLEWRKVAYKLASNQDNEHEEGWDSFFLNVVHPASMELDPIMRQFKNNIRLLSPQKPDAKNFYEFGERWRGKLKVL